MLKLSKCEFVVCAYTCAGYSAKETAHRLSRSTYTITTHLTKIRKKNKLKNAAEISREFALQHGDPKVFIKKI